jgi:hypothetical protein
VHSADYAICENALKVCRVRSVDQVIDQYFAKLEEKPKAEEEFAEYKATFLDALKGLEARSMYIHQFNTKNNIILISNKDENEL